MTSIAAIRHICLQKVSPALKDIYSSKERFWEHYLMTDALSASSVPLSVPPTIDNNLF